jgi:hypothetical protein
MNTKLTQFIKRNRRRNAHLYQPGLTEGQDYVVCPISSERLSMIKDNYITCVLGMNVEDYPPVQRICQGRKENIKQGLQKIDANTGLTVYEAGQIKARTALKQVDESGLSGYDRKGQKTRATHMNKIDELGRNGYSRLASKAIIKGNRTKAEKGLISIDRNEFHRYKAIVLYLTSKHRSKLSDGYITGLAGKENAWHIDHMFSILKGYQKQVSPFVIGHLANLRMLPWQDNLSKSATCSISMEELISNCDYTIERSTDEFNKVYQLILEDIKNNIPLNAAYLIERLYESTIH